ncbi:MAG: carbohydrate kinase family protein [Anaerolineaceae bacterium]|nr:carbohydrate kinase family protein [Anaerolineaceae bacterium]
MPKFLVSGLINIETTLRVDHFPLEYFPATYPFFGVHSTVSGVGYNLAKLFTVLGDEVAFLSAIADDDMGLLTRQTMDRDQIPMEDVLSVLRETAQSVILYDPSGRREIHTDLKDNQELTYPMERFARQMANADWLVLCNINYSRPMLSAAKAAGKRVACDVHAIASLDDEYNADFMRAAEVLFLSDELLPKAPESFALDLLERYHPQVLVIGMGAQGALLAVPGRQLMTRVPAVDTRPVVNTIGAGDALFGSFLHGYAAHGDALRALREASVFASYKIGARSAADGFLTAPEWQEWVRRVYGEN